MRHKILRGAEGFNLLELMVVIAIIGIISIFAVPLMTSTQNPREKVDAAAQEIAYVMRTVRSMSVAYRHTGYVMFRTDIPRIAAFIDMNEDGAATQDEIELVGLRLNVLDSTLPGAGSEPNVLDLQPKYNVAYGATGYNGVPGDNSKVEPLDPGNSLTGSVVPIFYDRAFNTDFRAVFYPNRTSSTGRILLHPESAMLPDLNQADNCDDGYTKAICLYRNGRVKVFTWLQTPPTGGTCGSGPGAWVTRY